MSDSVFPPVPASGAGASGDEDSVAADGLVRVLPDVLASKIAAGEVVQRPSSVAKELMENALDAGATEIALHLRKAGSDLIQIVDDGCGMGPADAVACFGRHATSKLRAIEDLDRLATLGFRGEALASVAAVAHVELKTKRRQDATGTAVRVEGGRLVEQKPCATPDGTSLAVRHLFFNVPARRNFLRSPATEFKHLVETFQTLALSNPAVGFTLTHDGMEVYRLLPPPAGAEADEALRLRVVGLFGDRHDGALVGVAETTSYLTVRGFVGTPGTARRARGEQFFFVNGRTIRSRALDAAVAGAFGGLLGEGAHPFFALFLSLDARHVDVNVHPAKTEVKFDDERGVFGFVRAVVKKGLGEADLALAWERGAQAVETGSAFPPAGSPSSGDEHAFSFGPGPLPDEGFDPDGPGGDGSRLRATGDPFGSTSFGTSPRVGRERPSVFGFDAADRAPSEPDVPEVRPAPIAARGASGADLVAPGLPGDLPRGELPVWQLHHRYVLTPIRTGLLVLDQRAAHERILYERALAAMDAGLAGSQQLLFPHTLEFGPADFALLVELLPDLRSLGFELEPLAGRGVLVRGVPTDISVGAERQLLDDLLAQYKDNRDTSALSGRDNLARSLARRSAIRPGHALPPAEARSLIDQLFACRDPYTDPAGRPTMVTLSLDEFERRFSRR